MEERILKVLKNVNEDILFYTGTNMLRDGVIDSFELIDVISILEEEFNVKISGEYVIFDNFANKTTIIDFITKLID